MFGSFKKVLGLNRRCLMIRSSEVRYLAEHELDGKLATNIHFADGTWVTAGLTLDETYATLFHEPSEDEEKAEEIENAKKLKSWRSMAMERAKIQREVDEAVRSMAGESLKCKSYSKHTMPDGSGKLEIFYEPEANKP